MRKALLALLGVMVFTLFTPTDSFSQMPNMNGWHAKYWFYRWRLRNDFMVMGEGPGQSLVAESRNLNRNGYIKWADATIMHGYYLTMLAIEHKMLQDRGRWADLKNNERELYYAIKAFERLDRVSETFYSSAPGYDEAYRVGDPTLPPDVNGYFFRDDVGPQFINMNPDPSLPKVFTPNYYSLMSGRTGIDYGPFGLDYNVSDYCGLWNTIYAGYGDSPPNLDFPQHPIVNYKDGHDNHDYYGHGEESQDQVIRLLLGFFTIIKSIPPIDYAIDIDKDGITDVTMNFCHEAKRHTTNIIGRMCGQFSGTTMAGVNENLPLGYPSLQILTSPVWTIMNPRHREVETGESPYMYMTPMQEIAGTMYTSGNDIGIGFDGYATLSYNSTGSTLWNAGLNGYNDWVNAKMALILNVITKSGTGFVPPPRFIANKSADRNIDGLYVPLYDYFWDWNPEENENDVERKQHAYDYATLLLQAAPCVGPHNFGYTSITNPDHSTLKPPFSANQEPDGIPLYWNVPFVFDNAHTRWDDGYVTDGTDTLIDEGWFSGVDFMLLYNLIYANNDGLKPFYHDLINRVVDYDINTDLYTDLHGYSATGLMIGAFENLTVKSNIYGNTPVTLKALDYVQLDEGIYDPNNMPDGITIEVGKITCGNDFTSSNTPYSIEQCQTCGLENQIGSLIAPESSGKNHSLPIKMTTAVELKEQAMFNQTVGLNTTIENEISIFPNPTTDFLRITTTEVIRKIVVSDQHGAVVKEFVSSNNLYDIRELASGVYTIILTLNNNETKHIKVVKL